MTGGPIHCTVNAIFFNQSYKITFLHCNRQLKEGTDFVFQFFFLKAKANFVMGIFVRILHKTEIW